MEHYKKVLEDTKGIISRLSIQQQPDLKLSDNFANCIIRKKVVSFQLKCSIAVRNLQRDMNMAGQNRTLGLRILLLRLQFHSQLFGSNCFYTQLPFCPSKLCFGSGAPSLSQHSCVWTSPPAAAPSAGAGPAVGTGDLGRAGIWACQLLPTSMPE